MSEGKDEIREGQVWHPIEDIRSLAETMSRSFRRPAEQKFALSENGEEFVIKVELPEVRKKDLQVNVSENAVTLFARWAKESRSRAKDRTERIESAEQIYSRTIQLPAAVKADLARATFRDRVLKIFLPRAKPSQVRRIDVE